MMTNKTDLIFLVSSLLLVLLFVFIIPSYLDESDSRNIQIKEQNLIIENKIIIENPINKYNKDNNIDYLSMAKDQINCIANKACNTSQINADVGKYWIFQETAKLNVDSGNMEYFIIAISTVEMIDDFDAKLCYDIVNDIFTGYKEKDECVLTLE